MTAQQRLRTLGVFRNPTFTLGLPRGLLVGLCLLALLWSAALAWWLGPLLLIAAYPPLLRAHESDPAAIAVWIRALTSSPDAISAEPTYRHITWE